MPVSIMTPQGPRTRVLVKANDDLVSLCTCGRGVATSAQLDCPWCGCGWLFVCSECKSAFTFAKCALVNESLEDIVTRELRKTREAAPSRRDIREGVAFYEDGLRDTLVGGEYVYFDGAVVDVTDNGFKCTGLFAEHDLDFVPQVRAVSDERVREEILENEGYWWSRAVERER